MKKPIPRYLELAVTDNMVLYNKATIVEGKLLKALSRYTGYPVEYLEEVMDACDQLSELVSYGCDNLEEALAEIERHAKENPPQ